MRPPFTIADAIALHAQLHAVAVAEWLGRDYTDHFRWFDFAQAAKLLHQNGALGVELKFVRGMLVVAASATAENRAFRYYPVGRCVQHFQRAGTHQAGLFLLRPGANPLTRQNKGREHHPPIEAG